MASVPHTEIERVFREEYGRAVAVLARVFGDIDIAEEAVQDAFATAVAALAGQRDAACAGRLDHTRPLVIAPSTGCAARPRAMTATPRPRCCTPTMSRSRRARCTTTACV